MEVVLLYEISSNCVKEEEDEEEEEEEEKKEIIWENIGNLERKWNNIESGERWNVERNDGEMYNQFGIGTVGARLKKKRKSTEVQQIIDIIQKKKQWGRSWIINNPRCINLDE